MWVLLCHYITDRNEVWITYYQFSRVIKWSFYSRAESWRRSKIKTYTTINFDKTRKECLEVHSSCWIGNALWWRPIFLRGRLETASNGQIGGGRNFALLQNLSLFNCYWYSNCYTTHHTSRRWTPFTFKWNCTFRIEISPIVGEGHLQISSINSNKQRRKGALVDCWIISASNLML